MTTSYAELRRNLVPDPRGAATTGWGGVAGTGGAAALSALTGIVGHPAGLTTAVRRSWTVASTDGTAGTWVGVPGNTTWGIPVTAGAAYGVSVWARSSRARPLRAFLAWYTAAGAGAGTTDTGIATTAAAGGWVNLAAGGVAPAGAVWATLVVYGGTSPVWSAGDTLDVTGALVERLAAGAGVGPYFDGSSAAPGGVLSYAWAGTVNASASVLRQQTVAADPGGTGVFLPMADTIWGLGSYDRPDVQFNGRDADGVDWVLAKVDGWKTTTGQTPVVRSDGADGGWFAPGSITPRVLTLRGAFRGCSVAQLDEAEARLRDAIEHVAEDQTLWMGPRMGGSAQQMTVRLTGALEVDDANATTRTWSAVMTAADPYKYAAGADGQRTFTTGLPQMLGLPGLQFPLAFPWDFGGADAAGGRITLVNPGKTVFPVVTFTGPGPNLHLSHLESGLSVGYQPLMVPGQKIVFDHGAQSVTGDGRSLYTRRAVGTTFFPLLPGVNSLSFTADAYDPNTRVSLTYRPRWT